MAAIRNFIKKRYSEKSTRLALINAIIVVTAAFGGISHEQAEALSTLVSVGIMGTPDKQLTA